MGDRWVVVGNAGAGKTTLARELARSRGLLHVDLDALAWSAGDPEVRRPDEEAAADLLARLRGRAGWVVEGCYAGLIERALPLCNRLVFLNPGVEVCVENCRRRPWEPHKYPSREAQDARLEMLIGWVRSYETRSDDFSLARHRRLFDAFAGEKHELRRLPPGGAGALPLTRDGGRWSNAEADRIALAEPDPQWGARFREEAERIRAALAPVCRPRIEHFGSTAVPGLPAKPVLDIALVVDDRAVWPALIGPLAGLGYVHWAENPRTDRMFFVKGMPPFGSGRTHHLHVRRAADVRAELGFRDWLRAHPGDANAYARLKRRLARLHPTDREAYTEGKSAFVREVLARADGEAG